MKNVVPSDPVPKIRMLALVCLFGALVWLWGTAGHAHDLEPPPEDEDLLTALMETPEATPGVVFIHRVGFGLVLILAFSVGLAAVLTIIGLLFVRARTFLNRLPIGTPAMRLLPAATAVVIMVLGLMITASALTQIMSMI
jgi:hypothetical protein